MRDTCHAHLNLLDLIILRNCTWRRLQVMKLLIMHFSPTTCHFIPLRSKYSPQHPVLKHPQNSRTCTEQNHISVSSSRCTWWTLWSTQPPNPRLLGKAVRERSYSSVQGHGWKCVQIHLHSFTRLHGVALLLSFLLYMPVANFIYMCLLVFLFLFLLTHFHYVLAAYTVFAIKQSKKDSDDTFI
jgi:hypothetical protein